MNQRPPSIPSATINRVKKSLDIVGAEYCLQRVIEMTNRLEYLEEAFQKARLKNRHYKEAVRGLERCIFRLKSLIHFPRFVMLEPSKLSEKEVESLKEEESPQALIPSLEVNLLDLEPSK